MGGGDVGLPPVTSSPASDQALHHVLSARKVLGLFWAITVLGAVLRLSAAVTAYPVAGDAGHFVQSGREFAEGNERGLTPTWSLAPVLTAAWAHTKGFDEQRMVQAVTVLTGILTVPLVGRLALRLGGGWLVALVISLLAAVNPRLIEYSTNGLAEGPFLFSLMLGLQFVPLGAVPRRPYLTLVTFFALGLGYYYRPPEACVATGLCGAWFAATCLWRRWRAGWAWLAAGLAVFILCAYPLVSLTRSRTGVSSPGTKIENLAYGDMGRDSKAMYDPDSALHDELKVYRSMGIAKYVWHRRMEIAGRWFRNMLDAMRLQNECVFPGGLSIGTLVFALLLGGAVLRLWATKRWVPLAVLLPAMLGMPALTALSFIYPRWMVPWFPFGLLLMTMAFTPMVTGRPAARWAGLALALCATYMGFIGTRSAGDGWRGYNTRRMAEWMKTYATEDQVVMAVTPGFAIEFYSRHPYRCVRMNYGELPRVVAQADATGTDFIVIDGNAFPHWPVHAWRTGTPPPPGWRLHEVKRFSRISARWGEEVHDFAVLARTEPVRKPTAAESGP